MSDHGHWICEKFEPESFGFIYLITNIKNNRKYIGKKQLQFKKSRRLKSRKNRKVSYSESDWKTYTGSCRELNEDIEKYGKENFTFEILVAPNAKGILASPGAYLSPLEIVPGGLKIPPMLGPDPNTPPVPATLSSDSILTKIFEKRPI